MKSRHLAPLLLASAILSLVTLFTIWSTLFLPGRDAGRDRSPGRPAEVTRVCARCHAAPGPNVLTKAGWPLQVGNMLRFQEASGNPVSEEERARITNYYVSNSPMVFDPLPYVTEPSGIVLEAQEIGDPPGEGVLICNVSTVDLDMDGECEVLACDAEGDRITWIRRVDGVWKETALETGIPDPGRSEALDFDGDGDLDIVVAVVGSLEPVDQLVGKVILLSNDGHCGFSSRPILEGVQRVADVRAGDFDGDGDWDFAFAAFGHTKGSIGWLEQVKGGAFIRHSLMGRNGAAQLATADLDGDGGLDLVAMIAQEHEEIVAFMNRGRGRFRARAIYQANNPRFGSSGIELADLDLDGDIDILYTNGDSWDQPSSANPCHGVQWLENLGDQQFKYHDIVRMYGAYRAIPGDMDSDGDLDIVVASMFNEWTDEKRLSLIWLENDGVQRYTARKIASTPKHLVTADVGDLDGDGRPDVVAGVLSLGRSTEGKSGRVTLWRNLGKTE